MLFIWIIAIGVAHAQWDLVWEENFDGDTINPDYWEHEVTAWGGGVRIHQISVENHTNVKNTHK